MENYLRKINLILFPCKENNYRPTLLDGRLLSYLAFLIIFLKFFGILYFVILPRTEFFASITSSTLINMTNNERERMGFHELRENPKLNQAAYLKANHMLAKNYFAHWSPDGVSPWHWFDVVGYKYAYAGENLAMGFLDAINVHNAWINSPSHRANIVNTNYDEIGIAVIKGNLHGQETYLVVQVFGRSRILPQVSPITQIQKEIPNISAEQIPNIIEKEIQEKKEENITKEENIQIVEENITSPTSILGDYDAGVYSIMPIREDSLKMNLFQFLMFEYDNFIQKIIILSLLFIGFILIANIFIRFDIQHPDLVFKGLFFLILFLIFEHLDQATILRILTDVPIIG